jgi:hypothetical protein
MARRQVSIAHCHLNHSMAHQVSDRPKIDSCHRQPARKGVTQTVLCEVLEAGLFDGWVEPMFIAADGLAAGALEYPLRAQRALPKSLKRGPRYEVQRNIAGLSALAMNIAICFRVRSTRSHVSAYCSLGLIPVCNAISNSGRCDGALSRIARRRRSSSSGLYCPR